jgi:hypothetical protein
VDAGPIKPSQVAGPQTGAGVTFLLLSLAGFAIGANLRITDPLLPTFALEFGTTVGAAAVVATVFSLAHGRFSSSMARSATASASCGSSPMER